MFIRIAIVTVLLAGFMGVLADGRLLERAGLVGGCREVSAAEDGSWQACHAGRLEGRPNLLKKGCVSHGMRADMEYWRCPATIVVSPAPRA